MTVRRSFWSEILHNLPAAKAQCPTCGDLRPVAERGPVCPVCGQAEGVRLLCDIAFEPEPEPVEVVADTSSTTTAAAEPAAGQAAAD